MSIILASQETEIRRTEVRSQPRQIVCETLSQKKLQKRTHGLTQGVGPEFKPQYRKKIKFKALAVAKGELLPLVGVLYESLWNPF
jgi:hypothetical protein